LNCNNISH